jgi:hypothetical protein
MFVRHYYVQKLILLQNYLQAKLTIKLQGNVPWGDHAEASTKQGREAIEHDLRDRGLCLVPVSWIPQAYRVGTAMDYWTPAYRGCLY